MLSEKLRLARYFLEVADIVALCDMNRQGIEKTARALDLDVPHFTDFRKMIASGGLDGVVITAANHVHAEITIAAAQAGLHVFCEKATARTVPECWRMVRACREYRVKLMIGHKRRLRPPWARMIELTDESLLGEVLSITVPEYVDNRPTGFFGTWWADPELSGGFFHAHGVHVIDWFRAMCGDAAQVWTQAFRSDNLDVQGVDREFDRLAAEAVDELRREGFSGHPIIQRSISMRYVGQNYEQEVTVPPGRITAETVEALFEAFHRQHEAFYGYRIGGEVIQLVHFNVSAIGVVSKPDLRPISPGGLPCPVCARPVYFKDEGGFVDCPIYRRSQLGAGLELVGPAIIEEEDSTTLVYAGQRLQVDEYGIFVLTD